jgi:hypothetical protein
VLATNPEHPGALHLYIHAVEAHDPGRAEGAADRLQPLMPGAGTWCNANTLWYCTRTPTT